MQTIMSTARGARQQILDLACLVSLYRVVGNPSFYELAERARQVAQAAARENVPLHTPITELFVNQQCRYGGGETLGWHYRRSYNTLDPNLDPLQFFTITYANNFATVASRCMCGASGEIVFDERSLHDIFECVEYDTPRSYHRWAHDEHPVGGYPLMLRMDEGQSEVGQLRLEVWDLHPCRGSLYFGEAVQESVQIAAFCRLLMRVQTLFDENRPTVERRAVVRKRATEIIGKASTFCFFPSDGFCYSCGGDVTAGVTNFAAAASETGCRFCFRSWCE